jgi:glutamate carboxypeptidase
VVGKAAHAGLDPDSGISAVHTLMNVLADVRGLERRELGTTINVGTIEGGIAPNVIAAHASATVDIRVARMGEYTRISNAVATISPLDARALLTVAELHGRPPMERTPRVTAAFLATQELARSAGIAIEEGSAGGASDGNLLAPLGVAVLDGLGPDGGGAHAADEHILLDSLSERIVLIALLLAQLELPTSSDQDLTPREREEVRSGH